MAQRRIGPEEVREGLAPFLVEAKKHTYADPSAHKVLLADGSKVLTFSSGSWSYKDQYDGEDPFDGEERVFFQDALLWKMSYRGFLFPDAAKKEVYAFLRSALRRVPEDVPVRGPDRFSNNGFTYQCYVHGKLDEFHGEEIISFKGPQVYRLRFHGGNMRLPEP